MLLVTEVYAAGEAPIEGADGRAICRAVRSRGKVEPVFVPQVESIADGAADVLRDGDVVADDGRGQHRRRRARAGARSWRRCAPAGGARP